jgi:predicted membrane-bound spermidine synthase
MPLFVQRFPNMQSASRLRAALYALFTLSGFAGLIYESIWSHYLKLFLGHAAYAQTLVLMMFMGGMTAGAWLVGRRRALRQPLLAYCLVEAALGIAAFGFDPLFRGMQNLVFDRIVPELASPLAIDLVKWGLGGLIVFPQSMLLGATFPLISAGVVRLAPDLAGRSLGWLYFTNSLGAAIGVLCSGYWLIPALGLPGTIMAAGLVNAMLALGVWLLWKSPAAQQPRPPAQPAAERGAPALLLAAAFITGAASFCYEIGWLRMLSLVLGSATHSFELMLAAFIAGLACGSFWIRNRIARQAEPLLLLGWIQLAMGSAAFLTIALFGSTFDWMAALLSALQHNDAGYIAFNLAGQGICLALMAPVTFLAGTTLPLITHSLMRAGGGEASIGRVYAMNTLGSIAGVLLAVHLVMPALGLRQVIVAGALLDLGLGLWLLLRGGALSGRTRLLAAGACVALAAGITAFVPFDPARTASGVFRNGRAYAPGPVIFHRDGKTATIDVNQNPGGSIGISTNGKPDASAFLDGRLIPDEYAQTLLGLLPLMVKPGAREVAVIGLGSGRTTHSLLLDPQLTSVETVEIEPAMAEGARQFGAFSHLAFDDPRSHIQFEDAKTHFARSHRQYDIIISEPSNPWVSGVSSLFSTEFYAQARRHLSPGGVLVQWTQLYEIDVPTLATALNALGAQFDDYAIYIANDWDILIVASPQGAVPPLSDTVFRNEAMAAALRRIHVHGLPDMQMRRLGGKASLAPFFLSRQRAMNSDYFPVLDRMAVKTRFLHSQAGDLLGLRPISRRLEAMDAPGTLSPQEHYTQGRAEEQAQVLAEYLAWRAGKGPQPQRPLDDPTLVRLTALQALNGPCEPQMLFGVWLPAFQDFAEQFLPYLSAGASAAIAGNLRAARCYAEAPALIHDWVDWFQAVGQRDLPKVQALSLALLPSVSEHQGDLDFVQQELLLADLQSGGAAAARKRLQDFGGINDHNLLLVYLWAQAYR